MPEKLLYPLVIAAFTAIAPPLSAQQVQIRVGAVVFSPLVEDEVSSSALEEEIPADQAHRIRLQQGIAPAVTTAVKYPLRRNLDVEISATYATSKLDAQDTFQTWDAGSLSVGNALFGVAYRWKPSVAIHGGVGLTKLFGSDAGMFAEGNGIRPLLEAGLSFSPPSNSSFGLELRAQSHTFSTRSLADEETSTGNVFRGFVGLSYTLGGGQ